MLTYDAFRQPCPFTPDVVVAIDDVVDDKVRLAACHESQFFEWLAHDRRWPAVPDHEADRLKWLKELALQRDQKQARIFRDLLRKRYPAAPAEWLYAESFALSEYGRALSPGEVDELIPF